MCQKERESIGIGVGCGESSKYERWGKPLVR